MTLRSNDFGTSPFFGSSQPCWAVSRPMSILHWNQKAQGLWSIRTKNISKVVVVRIAENRSALGLGSPYTSGRTRTRDWLKFKNPAAPAVKREAEADWFRS